MICQPGSTHLIRQHQSPTGHHPPPPPPYPGHSPSYARPQLPQVLTGDGLMVRTPIGSPLGGGPPVMRPQTHSPVMGNAPPLLMGGPHRMPLTPHLGGSQALRRPLLLQEQRLLIEDIIEEEKREQMKQQKAVNVQQHQSMPEGTIVGSPNIIRPSYQRLTSPITSGQMYSSPGPGPTLSRPVRPVDPGLHPALLQAGSRPSSSISQANLAIKTYPPPPLPPDNPQTDADFQMQQQYENWLNQQNNLIAVQQKHYDTEIAKLRRQRKSLNSRQRTLRKNGQELNEADASELDRIQKETTIIQRQLESCRKSSRQHTMLINEYNTKKKQRQMLQSHSPSSVISGSQQTLISGASPIGPSGSSPMHATPQSPLMSHSPSSQHSMGMSPMVPSPHTPVASPNPAAVPQHSPHSMVVPVPHPSPDHGGPFSPQTRMPSPSNTGTFSSSQSVNHSIIGHQSMRVRMPVLSPGNPGNPGNQMSSHMMVIRPNYSPGPILSQQQGQQLVLKHQYSQNVIPLRRPSGSGPVPSPSSSGICHSPVGPVPSPVSSIGIKPSPVQCGLKSPAPLSSPQMQSHITDNPGTPLTPRSNEMMGNPPTPHSDHGGFTSRVSSPHHSILTPTPPSPYVSCSSVMNNNIISDVSGVGGTFGTVNENNPNSEISGTLETISNVGGGGTNNNNIAPIPCTFPTISRYGHFTFGLKGGSPIRSRWGFLKFGLRGGQPSPVEESSVSTNTTETISSSNSATMQTPAVCTSIITSLSSSDNQPSKTENELQDDSSSKILKSVNFKVNFDTTEEGLAGVLSDCIRNSRISGGSSVIGISQPAYASAISTTASIYSLPYSKVVVPEPCKSDIPPSSRHQAVIGIPGGGAIPSQSSMYPTPSIDPTSGVRIPRVVSTANYSVPNSYSSVDPSSSEADRSKAIFVEGGGSSLVTHISSSTNTSSLIPAPIMSVKTTSSSLVTNVSKHPLISLAKDVNTLATVVSASNQVSLALSLGTTKSDVMRTQNPISSILSTSSESCISSLQETSPALRFVSSLPHKSSLGSLISSPLDGSFADHSSQQKNIVSTCGSVDQQVPLMESTTIAESSTAVSSICSTKSLSSQNTNVVSTLNSPSSIAVAARTQTHTLHHLPQQRLPVVLAAASQNSPALQVVTQQGQIVSSNLNGQSTRIIGTAIQPQPSNIVVHNQFGGHISSAHQMLQLPSLTHLNTNQLTRTQVVQSLSQYSHVVQSSPSGQLFVQHQQPTGMVLASNGSHVRMVGQQVMMQPGVIRGSSVMVKSSSQVQGSVKMMMIHNSGQRTPTPPPPSRQTPIMPPPAAKSPVLHSASPISRVSPAPSPVTHSVSPHSPQIKSHSPLISSPVSSPQLSLTPTPLTSGNQSDSGEGNVKEVHIPSAPNALLKQLLQNAGCSSGGAQGQLVLVRPASSGISSHLSQVATQIPNPSNITIPKSLSESSSTFFSIQPNPNQQSNTNAILNTSTSQAARSGMGPHQVTTVISSNIHSSENQSLSAPQMSTQSLGSLPPQTVIVNQTTSGGNIYTTQVTQGQIQTIIPTTQYIRQVGTGQTVSVPNSSSRTPPGLHASSNVSGQYGLNQAHIGVSSNQGRSQQLVQSPTNTSSLQNIYISNALQNSPRLSPVLTQNTSLAERIDNNPSVKTEMRVVIPDSGGNCSGPSTGGDHTPELNTPNDSCDDPEEAKKAKKRSQNQARRKSQSKDTKVQPAKRPRQGSRVEEDYESYIEGMMTQLRAMPPLSVLEPDVPRNFNVCPIYGCGDLSKLGRKDYNHKHGLLIGPEGSATVKDMNDHYNTQPFGPNKPLVSPVKKGPTQRGFYNQEFTPPKIGLPLDEYSNELDISLNSKSVGLSGRESDSPDTVLSSSSPECVMPESPPSFKGLRLVDMDDDPVDEQRDRSISPAVPLLVPFPVKPFALSAAEDDKKFWEFKDNKENYPSNFTNISIKSKIGLTPALPLKDMGNVTVSLTLSSQAGHDVSHVLRSLANLLNIPPPMTYDITDFTWDNNIKMRQMYKQFGGKEGKEQSVDMQSVLNGVIKFCKQCNSLIIQNIFNKKLAEMPFLSKDEWEGVDDISFCSKNCYIQFALAHRVVIDDKTGNLCSHLDGLGRMRSSEDFLNRKDNISISDDFIHDWNKDESLKEVLKVPHFEDERRGVKHKFEDDKEEVEEEEEEEEYPKQADGKRFRGHQYKYWTRETHSLPDKYEMPTNKEMTDLLFGMRITYRMSRLPEDSRQCSLCPLYGDYVSDGPSRLLNYDVDKWMHLNCALWAEDVYETMSGSLINVELALKKASNLVCEHCEQPGAFGKVFQSPMQ
ncbi:Histone-lysine N-methyltransferase trr [Armadillidium vulgare]|nr:Histone-lysine N-methyltransferase trr [Armadillidium vulgare]